ncbi:MAG: DNA adenine methylase [Myxococcota bacterium]
MIKYLGSKRTLVPTIVGVVQALVETGTVVDLFSGTSRVGHALKRAGYRVLANDHNAYAATLAACYVQADHERHAAEAERMLAELSRLPGRPGYFTETFCERSRFFQPKNGARVDAIRDAIEAWDLDPERKAVLLVALMEAADRVDSTTGLQMAYLKQWAPRSNNDLELRVPVLVPRATAGPGEAHGLDALDAAAALEGDVCYLDPPYNQHKYLGNYHIWETLVRWDAPEVFGRACKRIDCRTRASDFNSRRRAASALAAVVDRVRAKHLVVSFSDEGFLTRADIEGMLAPRGEMIVLERAFPRYVGARIGIYSPTGQKVGTMGHTRNVEHLFVVAGDAVAAARVRALVATEQAQAS